ncbi:unnamed protein product [Ostreobium quekettii]|uniref:Uncharacterized protein n=1 Tax=Ostreobium quekettii TaxID=121088 RepID=A0A8S1ITV6_9CHLO|nr:unnamed protein product [Ostreobium quekettii]
MDLFAPCLLGLGWPDTIDRMNRTDEPVEIAYPARRSASPECVQLLTCCKHTVVKHGCDDNARGRSDCSKDAQSKPVLSAPSASCMFAMTDKIFCLVIAVTNEQALPFILPKGASARLLLLGNGIKEIS